MSLCFTVLLSVSIALVESDSVVYNDSPMTSNGWQTSSPLHDRNAESEDESDDDGEHEMVSLAYPTTFFPYNDFMATLREATGGACVTSSQCVLPLPDTLLLFVMIGGDTNGDGIVDVGRFLSSCLTCLPTPRV